jgi:hypothetical protein
MAFMTMPNKDGFINDNITIYPFYFDVLFFCTMFL